MNSDLTIQEGIEIHAKALRRRLGEAAPRYARDRAEKACTRGDIEGENVWLGVAFAAEQLRDCDCALPMLGL